MKQLVIALDCPKPNQSELVECRRPRRREPQPRLTPGDLMPPRALDQRARDVCIESAANNTSANSAEQIDTVQLERLAQALLSKDHHDLAALAASNPALIEEWQLSFRQQRFAAERRARYWASAAAILATTKGLGGSSSRDKKSTH